MYEIQKKKSSLKELTKQYKLHSFCMRIVAYS